MKDVLKAILLGLVMLIAIAAPPAIAIYRWTDCRKVGHSVLYCLLDL